MNKKQWLRDCAQQFINKASMDTGEAAAAAESCAELEELTNGAEIDLWDKPTTAANQWLASAKD